MPGLPAPIHGDNEDAAACDQALALAWIAAIYLVVTSSKGISSVVMSRLLGTTQATAWRLGHAIREMSHDRYGPPLSGVVEIELKYFGGAPKRRKDGKKSKRGKGTSKPRILIAVLFSSSSMSPCCRLAKPKRKINLLPCRCAMIVLRRMIGLAGFCRVGIFRVPFRGMP